MEKLAIKLLELAENFKKAPFSFVKRNINLIVILPALFGGLWQVVELASMSFSFIRFFSVGQIIPDGLLVLLFLTSFFISTLILIHFWRKLDSKEDEETDRPILPKKGNVGYAFLLFILSMVFIFGLVYIDLYFIDNIESFATLIFYFPINILFAVISLIALYYSAFHCRDTKEWSKPLKEIVLSFKILPFIIPPTMFIFFVARFHEVFTFPIELKNVEYLVCKMEKIDESANIELLYSNDKYIFIRCDVFTKDWKGKPRTNEIRIFQFEELFDDTACVGSKRIRAQFVKDSIWDSRLAKSAER